jgi:hypothetical protein
MRRAKKKKGRERERERERRGDGETTSGGFKDGVNGSVTGTRPCPRLNSLLKKKKTAMMMVMVMKRTLASRANVVPVSPNQ